MNQLPGLADFNKRIQESFTNLEKRNEELVGKIKNQLKENLTKGLIDEETFKKAEEQLDNLVKAKKGEGIRGGHVIGHTKSGKPVYALKGAGIVEKKKYTAEDHFDAAKLHQDKANEYHGKASRSSSREHANYKTLANHHEEQSLHHSKEGNVKKQIEHSGSLSEAEKKTLSNQKKKLIEHHGEMHDHHRGLADLATIHADKHKGHENERHMRETAEYHNSKADHHKSEKERLESEKKGY